MKHRWMEGGSEAQTEGGSEAQMDGGRDRWRVGVTHRWREGVSEAQREEGMDGDAVARESSELLPGDLDTLWVLVGLQI